MPILNAGSDSAEHDIAEAVESLQQQRGALLTAMIEAQLGIRLLASQEAARLEQKRGSGDPHVEILRDRADTTLARVNALVVEREIAGVRTPSIAKTGALIEGRVTDASQLAAGRVSVRLVDEKGMELPGVTAAETDDTGYYAFVLAPETVASIGANARLKIALRVGSETLLPATATSFTIAPGRSTLQDVPLNTTELEKLGLRLPTTDKPVPDKPTSNEPTRPSPRRPGGDKNTPNP